MTQVDLSAVSKDLRKLPGYVVDKLNFWVRSVENFGIYEVRKVPGYHDEPLKGTRQGQRSIRLTKSYPAVYVMSGDKEIEVLIVKEVHNHDY